MSEAKDGRANVIVFISGRISHIGLKGLYFLSNRYQHRSIVQLFRYPLFLLGTYRPRKNQQRRNETMPCFRHSHLFFDGITAMQEAHIKSLRPHGHTLVFLPLTRS